MATKTITYNGEATVLPEKPMTLGNGLKSMPVTAAEQVVTNVETDERLSNDHLIMLYTHSGETLTGSGTNGKFKATATGTYTAFTIGGVSYAVKAGGETEIELTSGVWYSFILDTGAKTINFKAGGGVSNSKLALATATEADVLNGKTFYSGDKEIKTGTLVKGARGSVSVTYVGQSVTISLGFKPTYFMLFGGSQSPWMKYYECFNSSGGINAALRTLCGTTDDAGQQFSVSYSDTGVTIKKLDASHDQLGTFQYIAY